MQPTKICPKCKEAKPTAGFTSSYCPPCHAAYALADYRKNRETILAARKIARVTNGEIINKKRRNRHWKLDPVTKRARTLKASYGLTVEQYDQMMRDQNGVCAICEMEETRVDYRTGEVHPLPVDHDKITGKVRGLLCNLCNTAIGMLNHDAERMRAAIKYIECHEASEKAKETAK